MCELKKNNNNSNKNNWMTTNIEENQTENQAM